MEIQMKSIYLAAILILLAATIAKADPECAGLVNYPGTYKLVKPTCAPKAGNEITNMQLIILTPLPAPAKNIPAPTRIELFLTETAKPLGATIEPNKLGQFKCAVSGSTMTISSPENGITLNLTRGVLVLTHAECSGTYELAN
jgi:hypothetical protein